MRKEAEFYGISPLTNRLSLCIELETASCGGVLFHGFIQPPDLPSPEIEILEALKAKYDAATSHNGG